MSVLLEEVREQPDALRRIVAHVEEYADAAARLRGRRLVRLVGHGSSDNACTYGVYAFGTLAGTTALRDSISLSVYYGAELDVSDSAVVALSQSGRTQDVVAYVEAARARGALTVAVTNDLDSPLAAAAEVALGLHAGAERALPATKTYLTSVAALALLASGAALAPSVLEVADLLEEVVSLDVVAAAEALAEVERLVVAGRGFELATAREIALKLVETARLTADAMTTTAVAHGPLSALGERFPLLLVASEDAALPAAKALAKKARGVGVPVVSVGNVDWATLRVPRAPDPALAPLLSVVPGQVLAHALAGARGLDADRPAHLTKVIAAP